MLDGIFKVLGGYGDLTPRYTGPRCLQERMAVGGCDLCARACPHEAVEVGLSVSIDPGKCTGCGLCVQVCPTGALEYDVVSIMNDVRQQPVAAPDVGAKLVCSRSGEAGRAVTCLGRVTPSLIVAAGAWDRPLTLVHGDCASCSLGSPHVPESVAVAIEDAQLLRSATGRPAQVTLRAADPAQAGEGEAVSRRRMFGALARNARDVAAQLIPDQQLPFVDWSEPEERVPADWQWRLRALAPRPAPETPVYWPAPTIEDGCIDCPVCTNVCPTGAIAREVQPDGSVQLHLNLGACTGCDACQKSCPPQVIVMQTEWPYADFAEPRLLRDSTSSLESSYRTLLPGLAGDEPEHQADHEPGHPYAESSTPELLEPGVLPAGEDAWRE